jgi:hypothetical protein
MLLDLKVTPNSLDHNQLNMSSKNSHNGKSFVLPSAGVTQIKGQILSGQGAFEDGFKPL